MNEGIHLDLDTWIVPGQIRQANLCRGLGNRYKPAGTEVLISAVAHNTPPPFQAAQNATTVNTLLGATNQQVGAHQSTSRGTPINKAWQWQEEVRGGSGQKQCGQSWMPAWPPTCPVAHSCSCPTPALPLPRTCPRPMTGDGKGQGAGGREQGAGGRGQGPHPHH